MKRTHDSRIGMAGTGWQVLGELKLQVGSEANERMDAWLAGTLNKINIQADMIHKLTRSAQEAVARATKPGESAELGCWFHLLVFVPLEGISNGQAWGFFRIEKLAPVGMDERVERHVIEFYLYLEGARSS